MTRLICGRWWIWLALRDLVQGVRLPRHRQPLTLQRTEHLQPRSDPRLLKLPSCLCFASMEILWCVGSCSPPVAPLSS